MPLFPSCARTSFFVGTALAGALAWTPSARAEDPSRSYGGPAQVAWAGSEGEEPDQPPSSVAVEREPPPVSGPTADVSPAPKGVGKVPEHTPRVLRPLKIGKDPLVLGGYIQPGFIAVGKTEFNQEDQNGFDFANARFTGRGARAFYEDELHVGFFFNFDVNRGNFGVRDVYGSLWWRKELIALDVGQMKQPFGLALLQYEYGLQFSLSPVTRLLAFDRDQGIRLRSQGTVGRVWMQGQAMIANGEGGFRQRRNLDEKYQYTGRFEIGPLGEVPLFEPDLDNSPFRFVVGANAGFTNSLGKGLGLNDAGARETRVGADLRLHFRGLSARAEYIHGLRGANGPEPAIERYAAHGQIGYMLPIPITLPRFELVFRFTQYDLNTVFDGTEGSDYVVDNTARRLYEPGVAIYLAGHAAKLLLSYRLTDLIEGPRVDINGDPLLGDTFFAFFHFAWL